jgi:hypothetical protein
VEVIVSSAANAVAVAFDPCNGRRIGTGYVTVATGRDYSAVAPTSGSNIGMSRSRLTTDRRVGVIAAWPRLPLPARKLRRCRTRELLGAPVNVWSGTRSWP